MPKQVFQHCPPLISTSYGSADCKAAEEGGNAAEKEQCLRTLFLQEHPDTLQRFTADLLPLLLQVYGSTVLEKVSYNALNKYKANNGHSNAVCGFV